jgi:hypothetical protein
VVVHLHVGDLARDQLTAVDAEVDVILRVGVGHMHRPLTDLHADVHLLAQLAPQRLLVRLALFDAPARKLPEQRQRSGGWSLGDQVLAIELDDGPHHADLSPHASSIKARMLARMLGRGKRGLYP